jgi:hypothetical protein
MAKMLSMLSNAPRRVDTREPPASIPVVAQDGVILPYDESQIEGVNIATIVNISKKVIVLSRSI